MPKPMSTNRRAPTATTRKLTIGGASVRKAITLPDGEYNLLINSAELSATQKGNDIVRLDVSLADDPDQPKVRLQSMLVSIQGQSSDLTDDNQVMLLAMAGLPEGSEIGADELFTKIQGSTVAVELIEAEDNDGKPINRIIDVVLTEAAEG